MEVRLATEPAPGRPVNEDYAFATPGLVGVLDGVSVPAGLDTGCIHGPAWYVRRLADRLTSAYLRVPRAALPQLLADAIEAVRGDHDGHCDLDHPGTPAATIALVKDAGDRLEWLVLCDSMIAVDLGDEIQAFTDPRFAGAVRELRAPALTGQSAVGSEEHAARVRQTVTRQREKTNRADGYWIAAAKPEAAFQALTGSYPLTGPGRVRRAALLTDGASCAVDQFGLCSWAGLLDVLTEHGPHELIRRVRTAENADGDGYGRPRYKRHDDATAVLCLFNREE